MKIVFLKNAVQHHHWCFPFAVDGNPEPTISWLYNGQELKNSKFTYTKFMPDSGDGSVKHGCLNLNKPTHINNGNYTLIVQNKLGRDEATAFGLFMENPFGTLDPEGKILGEFLRLNISISRKMRLDEGLLVMAGCCLSICLCFRFCFHMLVPDGNLGKF